MFPKPYLEVVSRSSADDISRAHHSELEGERCVRVRGATRSTRQLIYVAGRLTNAGNTLSGEAPVEMEAATGIKCNVVYDVDSPTEVNIFTRTGVGGGEIDRHSG